MIRPVAAKGIVVPGLAQVAPSTSLNQLSLAATGHCLVGCASGEITGMALGTVFGFSNAATVALAIALAFVFGYALTSPLLRSGLALAAVVPIALAADTVSIAIMETIDNAFVLAVPGATDAGLDDALFWAALLGGFALAFGPAFVVNRANIGRGKGCCPPEAGCHRIPAPPDGDSGQRRAAYRVSKLVSSKMPTRLSLTQVLSP
jgi:hypothetical protein